MPGGLAHYHRALTATDAALAKALGLSETAQIARTEMRLRAFMLAAWERRARAAVERGAVVAGRGGTARAVETAVDKAMRPWQKDVNPKMGKGVEDIYRLARTAGWRKATGQTTAALTYDTPNLTEMRKAAPRAGFSVLPSFDLVDDAAVEALQGHQVFWIGGHYDDNISKAIASSAREAIVEAGKDQAAAGRLVRTALKVELGRVVTPGGFHGSATQYFEMLSANAATVSRAHGQMSSFLRVGATRYEIVNPRDGRTCFAPSVLVLMGDGSWKPIGRIEAGEQVVTREGRTRCVTGRAERISRSWASVEFDDGSRLQSTSDHRLANADGGWVEAGLSQGARIERLAPADEPALRRLRHSVQCSKESEQSTASRLLVGVLQTGASQAERSQEVGLQLQGLRTRVQGGSKSSESDLLHRPVCEEGLGRREDSEEVPPVCADLRDQHGSLRSLRMLFSGLFARTEAEGALARAAQEVLRALREGVPSQAIGGVFRQAQALLGALLQAAGLQRVQTLQSAIPGRAGRAGVAGALQLPVLSQERTTKQHRVGCGGGIDEGWRRLPAGGEVWSLGGRLPRSPESGDRDRRDVLALEEERPREGPTQASAVGSERLSSSPAAGGRGQEGSGSHSELARWSSPVERVTFSVHTGVAVDIEVEEDHSFVVWPGVVVHNCPVCSHMDGKIFTVEQGSAQLGKELAAKKPDDIKSVHPWIGVPRMKSLAPTAGKAPADQAGRLAKEGFSLPPFHGRCVLEGQRVAGVFQGASKARYTGQAVELVTFEGRRLTVTPNHPVLTAKGLTSADAITKGDQLVCDSRETGIPLLKTRPEWDEDNYPALVEKVFDAFAKTSGSSIVAPAPEDFHGDALGFHGDVEVVGAYRELLDYARLLMAKKLCEFVLEVAALGQSFKARSGLLDLPGQRLGDSARRFPGFRELTFHSTPVHPKRLPLQELCFGSASNLDARFLDTAGEGLPTEPAFVRKLLHGASGLVALDEVREVRHFDFAGHVYDFQTVSGLMVAQGIVISNCRCAVDITEDETFEGPGLPPS